MRGGFLGRPPRRRRRFRGRDRGRDRDRDRDRGRDRGLSSRAGRSARARWRRGCGGCCCCGCCGCCRCARLSASVSYVITRHFPSRGGLGPATTRRGSGPAGTVTVADVVRTVPAAVRRLGGHQRLEELTRVEHGFAHLLRTAVGVRRAVDPAVALHMSRVVHGERGDLLVVLLVGREPAVGREPCQQPVGLGDGLARGVDELLLDTGPSGDVLLTRLGGQRPRFQRPVPLHALVELALGRLGVAVVAGHGPVVLGAEPPLEPAPATAAPARSGDDEDGDDDDDDHRQQGDDPECGHGCLPGSRSVNGLSRSGLPVIRWPNGRALRYRRDHDLERDP